MKRFRYLNIMVLFLMITACSPMDDKYSQFIENGPITYIAKVNADSVVVNSGRNRIQLICPKSNDPRGKKAITYWANKTRQHEVPVNPSGETAFIIEALSEGSYIFEIIILDDLENSSITATVTGDVYGDNYERYLINRTLKSVTPGNNNSVILVFADLVDNTITGTEIIWKQDAEIRYEYVASSLNTGMLENFNALSFQYRTAYKPGKDAIDLFYAPYMPYVTNINPKDIVFDKNRKTFTFPEINDGNWAGIEIKWKEGENERTYTLDAPDNTATITDYEGREIYYRTFFRFDASPEVVYASEEIYNTSAPVDLDRSAWTSTQSHERPVDAAITNAANSHIDGDDISCLSLVKPGKKVGEIEPGNDAVVYFIIDMGSQQEFDYFRIRHRNNKNAALRVWEVSFYGSDDGVNFAAIPIPNYDVTTVPEVKVDLPPSKYQYIKMTYDKWDTKTSNTMQIAEFYLGVTK